MDLYTKEHKANQSEESNRNVEAEDKGQKQGQETESQSQQKIQEDALIRAIEEANKKIVGPREFEFSIHEKTKEIMVKVVDTDTKEVLKEIPPKKLLDIMASICEFAGLFIDENR